jgi:hypothetical protein
MGCAMIDAPRRTREGASEGHIRQSAVACSLFVVTYEQRAQSIGSCFRLRARRTRESGRSGKEDKIRVSQLKSKLEAFKGDTVGMSEWGFNM